MNRLLVLFGLLLAGNFVFAQTEIDKGMAAITEDAVRGQLEFLASDWTEGRAVGTKGAYLAADYIAAMFKTYGVKPFGDAAMTQVSRSDWMKGVRPERYNTYFQNFSLIEYEPGDEQSFSVITSKNGSQSTIDFGFRTDYEVRTGTVGQTVSAGLVFAGYGYENKEEKYSDLEKVDLEGKIAVILSGYPGHKDSTSAGFEKFTPDGRYAWRAMSTDRTKRLKEAGVVAIITITPGYDPTNRWSQNQIYPVKGRYYEADKPLSSFYTRRMSMPGKELQSSLASFTITPRVANEILNGSGIDLEEFEKKAAQLKSGSVELEGKAVAFQTSVKSKIVKARNVVGIIEGEKKDEFIVVGGHYDHLGKHDGWIFNGADDNASGTVGVMTIAKAFMATGKKPEKSVIFAAWTAEEKGLFGSRYFVKDAQEKDMNIVLNLNYDMIARDTERDTLKNMAGMVYTKAFAGIEEATRKHMDEHAINLDLKYSPSEKPSGGSDHAPFAQVGIPVFYFMAAMHPDYHQPSDELNKINWEKMTNIIRIGFLNTWEFSNSEKFLQPVEDIAEDRGK